jgi:O-antigen ligase
MRAAGVFLLPDGGVEPQMNASTGRSRLEKATWLLWIVFLVSLPITSFPYFPPALGGAALVRPLALYPLIGLLILATLPRLWKGALPRPFLALLAFAIVAAASTLLAQFSGIQELRGVSLLERSARNLITLGIGGAFYLTVALLPRNPHELRASLRWLYTGMGLALAWGTLQAVYVLIYIPAYFNLLDRLQRLISTRKLFPARVSGLTFEPNWFAEQISFLLLPWLLAAIFSGQTVFRWRWRWLTIETLLAVWAIGVLVFTYSRAGLFVMALLILICILFFTPRLKRAAAGWRSYSRRIVLALVLVGVLAAVLFAAGSQNKYFARLWRFWTDPESGDSFLTYIAFSQRFVYWEAAYRMFEANPVFGAGLGNFAFYFADLLPDQPLYKTPELLRQITPEAGRDKLITPKNLHIKILAETGLVGMATYLAFLIALAGCVLYLLARAGPEGAYWGRAGVLGLTAFLFAALSYDSFALPNMWVIFGLITSSALIFSKSRSSTVSGG